MYYKLYNIHKVCDGVNIKIVELCRVISRIGKSTSAECLAWALTTNDSLGFPTYHIADASQWDECSPRANQTL